MVDFQEGFCIHLWDLWSDVYDRWVFGHLSNKDISSQIEAMPTNYAATASCYHCFKHGFFNNTYSLII